MCARQAQEEYFDYRVYTHYNLFLKKLFNGGGRYVWNFKKRTKKKLNYL